MPPEESIKKELTFKTSRSSGPGGQHVNKTSSRIEVLFDLEATLLFDEEQKARLTSKLGSYLDSKGIIHVISSEHRSQLRNKTTAISKFLELIKKGLQVPKKRKPTKPSKRAIQKRLKSKNLNALKKERRKGGNHF